MQKHLYCLFLSALSCILHAQNVLPAKTSTITKPIESHPDVNGSSIVSCSNHFPNSIKFISTSIVEQWSALATLRAFSFTPEQIDSELAGLKLCFTEQGWNSFNDALLKSGNINAIKAQHLTVSAEITGQVSVHALKLNQWKVILPIRVVYQNAQEKLTQINGVNLLVGRKSSGDLGIMQIIVSPQPKESAIPMNTNTVKDAKINSVEPN